MTVGIVLILMLVSAFFAWRWYEAERELDEVYDELDDARRRIKHFRWSGCEERQW